MCFINRLEDPIVDNDDRGNQLLDFGNKSHLPHTHIHVVNRRKKKEGLIMVKDREMGCKLMCVYAQYYP